MLELTDITVRYPGAEQAAVDGATLTLGQGEILALLGPSGCGKSSLLRAVAGLEAHTGAVAWGGERLNDIPVHARGIGLMFQEGQLFPHRTVGGNVAFGLQMAGMARAKRARRVAELLDLVGLSGYGGRRISTLSGGEQQRVALARSLAPNPKLLLLDEPLSALDRNLRERLTVDLAQILRTTGTTALYVTHDHDEAFAVADRVALMRAGHLVQVAAPTQLFAQPVDEWAAQFLGYRIVDDGAHRLALGARALRLAPSGPLVGVVVNVTVYRGEVVLDVNISGWGRHRVIAGQGNCVVGEQVRIDVDERAVVRFPSQVVPASAPA